MSKIRITPKSYTAASATKHVRQVVMILQPTCQVGPRVQNLVLGGAAGIAFLSASWSATVAFLDGESGRDDEGPFVFAKATGIAEALRGQAATVAFAFYRMRLGGLVQMFVQIDTPDVRAKIDDRYLSERPFDIESEDEIELLQGLITRDELEVCFVAPGESGPCTGQFGLRASFPEDVRKLLNKELEDLLAYDRALSGRHSQGAVDQYNCENPMDATPVLSPNLDTRKFLGMSEEKALEEVGRSGIRQEDVCEVKTTRRRQQKKAEGSGKDAESAIDNAKALRPSDAIDIAPPQIVQEGPGTCPICGMNLTEKRNQP